MRRTITRPEAEDAYQSAASLSSFFPISKEEQ